MNDVKYKYFKTADLPAQKREERIFLFGIIVVTSEKQVVRRSASTADSELLISCWITNPAQLWILFWPFKPIYFVVWVKIDSTSYFKYVDFKFGWFFFNHDFVPVLDPCMLRIWSGNNQPKLPSLTRFKDFLVWKYFFFLLFHIYLFIQIIFWK